LNEPEMARAIQMLEDGATMRTVAERFDVSASVVHRLWTRYRETGLYHRRPGQGRKRKTTPRQDRYLRQMCLRNRQATAKRLRNDFSTANNIRLSDQTVRNRLHEVGLHSRVPFRTPVLTPHHHTARLEFAREHLTWELRYWWSDLFSDESRFHISQCDRRVRVWRRQGERYDDCNTVEHDTFGGGCIMVWGGISLDGRTELIIIRRGTINAQRYRDEVLAPVVVLYAGTIGEDFIFMHDNA
jgi:transposase